MLAGCPQSRPGAGLPAAQHHQEQVEGPGSDLPRVWCCLGGWGQSRQRTSQSQTSTSCGCQTAAALLFCTTDVVHKIISALIKFSFKFQFNKECGLSLNMLQPCLNDLGCATFCYLQPIVSTQHKN